MKNYIVTLPINRGGCTHLQEKINDDKRDLYVWWEFSRLPKDLEVGTRLYIVCEGTIRGYFIVSDIGPREGIITQVFLRNWVGLKTTIPMKGFPGYHEYKEANNRA